MESRPLKTPYFVLICSLSLLLLSLLVIVFHIKGQQSTAELAEEALLAGDYSEAAALYLELGDDVMHGQCMQLLQEQSYLNARRSLQIGSYEASLPLLIELGEYKDSENLTEACRYLWAQELCRQGDFQKAWELCLYLEDYPGYEALLEKCCAGLCSYAEELARYGNYAEALEIWTELGDYGNCENLSFRAERMLSWLESPDEERLTNPEKLHNSSYYKKVYADENAYIVVPEKPTPDCRFFVYYPGGTDAEINIDFLTYYLMNPAPDTVALFLRRNGIKDMEAKNGQALELLDRAAAECGVFPTEIMVCGSSMGAYPAMHSPRLCMEQLGLKVSCVLSLDAGADWNTIYALRDWQCIDTMECGTEFYLFESPWVGLDRPAIKRMVKAGIDVTLVGCSYDEHVRITLDAMGMGIIHWALGDRSLPCGLDIYSFRKLSLE